jgi:hypothetical protein
MSLSNGLVFRSPSVLFYDKFFTLGRHPSCLLPDAEYVNFLASYENKYPVSESITSAATLFSVKQNNVKHIFKHTL